MTGPAMAAYDYFLRFGAVFLGVTMCVCLLRAILGPRLTDRIVAVNIIGCKVIILFALLAVLLDEHYLLDVAFAYSLISFLAVVVLSKVFLSGYSDEDYERKLNGRKKQEAGRHGDS